MPSKLPRREFLQVSAAAGLAAATTRSVSAEEKSQPIRLGFIGVGSRGSVHLRLALAAGMQVPAICDIDEARLNRAMESVKKARPGSKPAGYSQGPTDYRRLLAHDDLDAVVIATPMQDHAAMSVDALRAGKHVYSEVAAAMTVDQCWALVRAAEETGRIYMLGENCLYMRDLMMVGRMAAEGVFGEMTYAECGYVHDCRYLLFKPDGSLTWRGEKARDYSGCLYPTHSLGPAARWLGIHRGDRMVSLVAMASREAGIRYYAGQKSPAASAARESSYKVGDSTNVLIRTAQGKLIDLRCDMYSARPHPRTTYYNLQGLKASYESRLGPMGSVWIEGRSKPNQWEPMEQYADEFEDPLWAEDGQKAEGAGHGGCDYFITREFYRAVRAGGRSPIDVYDAAAWSVILPLSGKSIAEGGAPQEIPDFTRGKWEGSRE